MVYSLVYLHVLSAVQSIALGAKLDDGSVAVGAALLATEARAAKLAAFMGGAAQPVSDADVTTTDGAAAMDEVGTTAASEDSPGESYSSPSLTCPMGAI